MPRSKLLQTNFLICILAFANSLALKAQDIIKPALQVRNSINVYVGVFEYNINYERNILQKSNSNSNLRLGFGHGAFLNAGEGKYINPAFVHLIGKKNSFFEINAGLKCMITNSIAEPKFFEEFVPDIFLGYRFEKPEKGVTFRAGFSFSTAINIGFGYKF